MATRNFLRWMPFITASSPLPQSDMVSLKFRLLTYSHIICLGNRRCNCGTIRSAFFLRICASWSWYCWRSLRYIQRGCHGLSGAADCHSIVVIILFIMPINVAIGGGDEEKSISGSCKNERNCFEGQQKDSCFRYFTTIKQSSVRVFQMNHCHENL